jgi:beta-galactosidase
MNKSNTILFFFTILFFCNGSIVNAQQSNTMYIGSAYYPNQLSSVEIEKDARLMESAGFNMVRIGDLVWSSMEPSEGKYEFTWLHKAIQILSSHGIKVMLATPTAAIPKWMYDKHPEIMQITANGIPKPYGKRRNICLNNPVFQNYCTQLVTALAKEFKDNKNVIAYQVDNELMAEEPYCYCSYCQKKFAQFLSKKYANINTLNKAWNLSFWSQTLTSFQEAFLPRKGDNPSAFQNYQEFCSDYTIDFYNLQRKIIKTYMPSVSVTHNICSSGFLYQLDLYKIAKSCDFMSIDNYPYAWTLENEYGNKGPFEYSPHMASLALSQIRGAKHIPFWVTEAQIGRTAGNQRKIVEPGMVRLWSVQEMAEGATGISFFPFRAFSAGHEHAMAGVLDEDNIPRRKYAEAKQVASELSIIRKKTGVTMPNAPIAIIRDFKNDWAFEDGRFAFDFRYMREVFKYYQTCRNASLTTDIISSSDNFDHYGLIIVPHMVLINKDVCDRLSKAANNGATIIITCMSGLKNDDMHSFGRMIHPEIEALAGINIQEQYALIGVEETQLSLLNDTTAYSCGLWHDIFTLNTATPLGFYNSRFFKGQPAITKNKYGRGTVYYIGSVVDNKVVQIVLNDALKTSNISPVVISSNDLVEITEVKNAHNRFIYSINYSNQNQNIELKIPLKDILTGRVFTSSVMIKANDYSIFMIEEPNLIQK